MIADKLEKYKKYQVYNKETGQIVRELPTRYQAELLISDLESPDQKYPVYPGTYGILEVETKEYKKYKIIYDIVVLVFGLAFVYLFCQIPSCMRNLF